jgi:hypothetical protein
MAGATGSGLSGVKGLYEKRGFFHFQSPKPQGGVRPPAVAQGARNTLNNISPSGDRVSALDGGPENRSAHEIDSLLSKCRHSTILCYVAKRPPFDLSAFGDFVTSGAWKFTVCGSWQQ